MKNPLLITVIVAVLVGVGAFFGGMKYQESKAAANPGNGQFMRGGNGGPGGRRGQGGGRVVGEIVTQDDKSITVKMMDGSSKIVLISGTTNINKAAAATQADLKVGERVGVFGSDNSDGSVTAQTIQLNPMERGPQGGQSPSPAAK